MPGGGELERRWLVADPLPADLLRAAAQTERIEQGYLAVAADGAEVRLRRSGGELLLSVKSGAGLVRRETTVELTAAQFDALWPATAGARLEKLRHHISDASTSAGASASVSATAVIELDVFAGVLAGLILAEIEFPDAATAAAFEPPAWLGPEVTDDGRYSNHSLALRGCP